MSKAISVRPSGKTSVMAVVAVLLLMSVVMVAWSLATIGEREGNPATHAASTGGTGSSIAHDPYIERHAEVVARYHHGVDPDVPGTAKDPYIHSRAEVIARHNGGGIR